MRNRLACLRQGEEEAMQRSFPAKCNGQGGATSGRSGNGEILLELALCREEQLMEGLAEEFKVSASVGISERK